jgi:nascent polypeptide-associated complex subunit alpha
MLPGLGRGMNPHKMKRMMKQMGINIDELTDVEKIIIRTSDKEYIFNSDVSVTIMNAQGQKTFQIIGEPQIKERTGGETAEEDSEDEASIEEVESEEDSEELSIPQGDVELVMSQTGASEEDARTALEACNGNPAEAILKLLENQ